jgi:nucleotide-binding universal stress UspA family protein
MFSKILAATARPLECDESVLTASRIAQHSHADLHILHVLESDAAIYRNYVKHYKTGEEVVGNEAYHQEVKQALYENCRAEIAPLDKMNIRISVGVPWMEILRWAREMSVDLIVLGSRIGKVADGERAAVRATVGSTADGVIRHERCPLMICSRPITQKKVAFEKILVGIDFSPSCVCAFQFALKLAQKRGSKLCLFHMLPVPPQPEYSQTQYESEIRRKEQQLNDEFRNQISSTIESEIATWGGVYPDIEILKYAQRKDVDLIAMGSHTKIKGEFEKSRWYVGSAVERVSARSVCPVAVITDPKVLQKWEEE